MESRRFIADVCAPINNSLDATACRILDEVAFFIKMRQDTLVVAGLKIKELLIGQGNGPQGISPPARKKYCAGIDQAQRLDGCYEPVNPPGDASDESQHQNCLHLSRVRVLD